MINKYYKIVTAIVLIVFSFNTQAKDISGNTCADCSEFDINVVEDNVNIESWMSDDSFWVVTPKENMVYIQDEFIKKQRPIEDWMLDNSFWKVNDYPENELVLENWMLDPDFWML